MLDYQEAKRLNVKGSDRIKCHMRPNAWSSFFGTWEVDLIPGLMMKGLPNNFVTNLYGSIGSAIRLSTLLLLQDLHMIMEAVLIRDA